MVNLLSSLFLLAFALFGLLAFSLVLQGLASTVSSPPGLGENSSLGFQLYLLHFLFSPLFCQPTLLLDLVALHLKDSIGFLQLIQLPFVLFTIIFTYLQISLKQAMVAVIVLRGKRMKGKGGEQERW